jgi:predicted phage tail protein
MSKLIKGSGGGGKAGGGSARTPVESPDSLRSIQYARVLDLVAEGEIGGLVNGLKSIYLDDTPLQNANGTFNFTGVSVFARNGTQSQSHIPAFAGSEAELPVSTQVTKAVPVTRSISNINNTAARVTLSIPQLTFQNLTNGDLGGTSVEIAIDVQNNGGGFVAQALRNLYQARLLSITPSGAISAAVSTKYQVVVAWAGQNVKAPQTCTYQLQYRAVGNVTWLVSQSHTFQGGAFSTGGLADYALGSSSANYPSGSKTFDLTLAENDYEFRVVKTSGSVQNPPVFFNVPAAPSVGLSYGGSVSITGGSVYAPAYTDVITGKTSSRYQRSYRIELPEGGPWDIRVRRITDDSVASNLQNDTYFDSITEIIDAKLTYPNSAIVGLSIDAKQFNNIPTRGYEIYGLLIKVPSNYNPLTRAYTGTWDGTFTTAWSDNPAWVFYDMVTNARYGLGEFVSEDQVDKWGLYTIAQYCDVMVEDGFGGIEPRFTCNLYLQTREEAYRVVANLASIFRAVTFWGGGEVRVSQDAPQDVEQLFTKANVIEGQFSYSGSSGSVRHTVVLVSWNDPQDAYRQKIEYVDDDVAIARYGVIQTEIVALGCTSRGQAARVGRWLIYSEQNETETVTFRAGMDSVYVSAGSVISTQDPNRAGVRMGGRILASSLSSVTLDAPVTIGSGTYTLAIKLPDNSIQERTITNGVGSTSVLNVSSDFSQLPQRLAVWILSSDSLLSEQWRVVSISEVEKTQFEITALAYRSDKYEAIEQDLILEPLPTSIINTGPPDSPNNLTVTESLYLAGLSVVGVAASVSWNNVVGAATYVLTYQLENQNPVTLNNLNNNTVDIKPMAEGNYTLTVYAVNSLGRRSQGNSISITINGKTTPPVDITNLQVAPLGSIGLFTWAPATDLDVIVGGKVRFRYSPNTSATWDLAYDLTGQVAGASTNATFPLQAGIYLAKFEDGTGNQSENAVSIITDAANIIALNFVESLQGDPDWTGTKVNTQYYPDFNGLLLSSADMWDSAELMDSDEMMDFGGGVATSGTYNFGIIDLGVVKTSRVNALLEARGIDLLDTWDSNELMDSTQLMDGDVVADVSAAMYMRTTNDDPHATPTWSGWITSTLSDISARGFEFELRLTSGHSYHNVLVEAASAQVDMSDLIQSGDDIVSGTGIYTVTFNTPFQIIPAVGVTAQNLATGDYFTVTAKSQTGFSVRFFNSANVGISKTFDYIAKAY